MKQIVLEYAGAVIAVLGAISFFLVFNPFFVGQEGVLGQMIQYSIGEKTLSENNAFDTYMEKTAPSIMPKSGVVIVSNERISLMNCYEAKDGKGGVLPVYLKRAWELNGNQTSLGASEDGTSICATKSGIYWIELSASDASGNEISRIFKILVNER